MSFQDKMKQLGETSGEHAITESIIAAYNALMEGVFGPDLPDSKVYVSADGSQVLGLTWGNNPENIEPEGYDDDDVENEENYLAQGYDCYTLGDIYDVDDGFDVSLLPSDPRDLEDLEGKGLTLQANLEQRLYKSDSMPTEEDALGVYVNPDEGWKQVPPRI